LQIKDQRLPPRKEEAEFLKDHSRLDQGSRSVAKENVIPGSAFKKLAK
jgi:hypothetical protein